MAAIALTAGGCQPLSESGASSAAGEVLGSRPLPSPMPVQPSLAADRPNIVLVLMDDFSMELLRTMASAQEMARIGASYDNSFVADSLCCVSRASTFTGQYPFQTRVFGNTPNLPNKWGPVGGYQAFASNGDPKRTFNIQLQKAGYQTGFIGKYLNGYEYNPRAKTFPRVPPGWNDFQAVFGSAYDEFGFYATHTVGDQVAVQAYPKEPASATPALKDEAYAGNVMADKAVDYIDEHEKSGSPYFLEVATYGVHRAAVVAHQNDLTKTYPGDPAFAPAFEDRASPIEPDGGNCGLVPCADLTTRDLTGFDTTKADNRPRWADGTLAPSWRNWQGGISAPNAVRVLRLRAQMAQSIDRMVQRIMAAVGPNTYVFLTSDNGFHTGQDDLDVGKGTPYDVDTRVPLLVVGPGVAAGARDDMVSNIDLAPTFEQLAGASTPSWVSGDSLVPSLQDPTVAPHHYVFFEHTWQQFHLEDPDAVSRSDMMGFIPSYVAVRSAHALLVRLELPGRRRPAYEFYDYRDNGWEKTNTFARPDKQAEVAQLMAKLHQWDACSGVMGGEAVSEPCTHLTE